MPAARTPYRPWSASPAASSLNLMLHHATRSSTRRTVSSTLRYAPHIGDCTTSLTQPLEKPGSRALEAFRLARAELMAYAAEHVKLDERVGCRDTLQHRQRSERVPFALNDQRRTAHGCQRG